MERAPDRGCQEQPYCLAPCRARFGRMVHMGACHCCEGRLYPLSRAVVRGVGVVWSSLRLVHDPRRGRFVSRCRARWNILVGGVLLAGWDALCYAALHESEARRGEAQRGEAGLLPN